jgi:hypothetical protein
MKTFKQFMVVAEGSVDFDNKDAPNRSGWTPAEKMRAKMKRTGIENPDHKPSDKDYARYGGMSAAYNKGKGYKTKMGFAGKKNKDEKGSKIGKNRRDATTPKGVKDTEKHFSSGGKSATGRFGDRPSKRIDKDNVTFKSGSKDKMSVIHKGDKGEGRKGDAKRTTFRRGTGRRKNKGPND